MKQQFLKVRKYARQAGQGMTEYLIVVALIAISAIAVFSFFGQTMRHQVAGIANELAGEDSTSSVTNAKTAASNANNPQKGTKPVNMGDYSSAKILNEK